MSKLIWHTTDEAPKWWVSIAFYVDGFLYEGYYESEFNQYGIFGADKVEKWCYSKELSSYILALETELEHTRKALEIAVDALKDNLSQANFTQMLDASRFHCIRTKCELALEQITALEQKDVK